MSRYISPALYAYALRHKVVLERLASGDYVVKHPASGRVLRRSTGPREMDGYVLVDDYLTEGAFDDSFRKRFRRLLGL